MGASDMISVYVREVLVQLWTPDSLRGRVNAVYMLMITRLERARRGARRFLGGADRRRRRDRARRRLRPRWWPALWAKWFPALRKADDLDRVDARKRRRDRSRPDA